MLVFTPFHTLLFRFIFWFLKGCVPYICSFFHLYLLQLLVLVLVLSLFLIFLIEDCNLLYLHHILIHLVFYETCCLVFYQQILPSQNLIIVLSSLEGGFLTFMSIQYDSHFTYNQICCWLTSICEVHFVFQFPYSLRLMLWNLVHASLYTARYIPVTLLVLLWIPLSANFSHSLPGLWFRTRSFCSLAQASDLTIPTPSSLLLIPFLAYLELQERLKPYLG